MKKHHDLGLSKLLLGDGIVIYKVEEKDDEVVLFAKSTSFMCLCPECGKPSVTQCSTYERTLQDIPIHFKVSSARVNLYKYKCENKDCSKKVFCERLSFAKRYQRRTDEVNTLLLSVSINESHKGASTTLRNIGVKTSNSSIGRLWDKMQTFEDTSKIHFIGVDDVALLTNNEYATVIYDMETHDLIALLPGRDGQSLREWLKEHPNIVAIARDRDSAYAKVINEFCPEAVQIADRFHLFQNLSSHIWEAMKKTIPESFVFKDGKITTQLIKKMPVLQVPLDSPALLELKAYDNSVPLDEFGQEVVYDNKKRDLDSKQYKEQAKNRKAKQQKIIEIQADFQQLDCSEKTTAEALNILAEKFDTGITTVRKYLKMTEKDIEAMSRPINYKKRTTLMDDYLNIIYKMLRDNISAPLIFSYILTLGYDKSYNTLSNYICLIAKNNFNKQIHQSFAFKWVDPPNINRLNRSDLREFITSRKGTGEEIKEELFLGAVKNYPVLLEFEAMYEEFHRILMGNQRNELDEFIEIYSEGYISGFVKQMKKDIEPIKNSISFEESSGFVEGGNHKFKLIKRICYGRMSLKNLFKKCWFAFKADGDYFKLSEMINQSFNRAS